MSAIGAEANPSGPTYWLAAPGKPLTKTLDHLQSILEQLRAAHGATPLVKDDLEAVISAQCVNFSYQKVKNYRRRLSICVARCRELSIRGGLQSGS